MILNEHVMPFQGPHRLIADRNDDIGLCGLTSPKHDFCYSALQVGAVLFFQ